MALQKIKVKDYGDDWINRLAVILKTIEQMSDAERAASLTFILDKYQRRVNR